MMRINFILARYNIDEIFFGNHWFYPLRILVYLNPFYWATRNRLSRGERIRLAVEALGPIFVKAGQIVSTRRDLIPDDIALELAKLQDRVAPFSGELAKNMIESALQQPLTEIFSNFNTQALASASIAQVHAAELKSGEQVVVKVLRPQINRIIERDISLLRSLARLAERYSSRARDFKALDIVNEIAQTLHDELDLMREAANASQLKRHFQHSRLLHIPKIYWLWCRKNILVAERIYGIPVHDIERLRRSGYNMIKLAERNIELFFTQVFRDSFFHADLHPGNIFVSEKNPADPTYIFVDFGIVGSLSRLDQRYLAENMIAFFKRDYQRVAELHIACGWVPPTTRVDQFEGAIRCVSEPIFELPPSDMSYGQLLLRLFQVARHFKINIQPQLLLLQKTLLSVEGLSRQLAPGFDIWQSAAPQIEKWLKNQVGIKAFLGRVRENLPLWSEQLPAIPSLVYEVLNETKLQQEKFRFKQMTEKNDSTNKTKRERSLKLKAFSLGVMVSAVTAGAVLYFIR
jgi:ubiquinone biosynthesis protein